MINAPSEGAFNDRGTTGIIRTVTLYALRTGSLILIYNIYVDYKIKISVKTQISFRARTVNSEVKTPDPGTSK